MSGGSALSSRGGAITITGEGADNDHDAHGVAITGKATLDAGSGKISVHGRAKTTAYEGVSAGVLIASDEFGFPTLQSSSPASDSLVINGDASAATADEAWGVKVHGSATIRSAGSITITGKAGTSAVTSTKPGEFLVAGIGLIADKEILVETETGPTPKLEAGTIRIASTGGLVTLQGTVGSANNSTDLLTVGNVVISSTPPPPPPPPPPPVLPPVTPTVPEVPTTPTAPTTPTTPATPGTDAGNGSGPGTPATGTSGTDTSGPGPGPGSTGGASSNTSSSSSRSALADTSSIQTVLQTVAQITAGPTTTITPATPTTGASTGATTPQTFLSALEQGTATQGTATQGTAARTGEGQGTQPAGGSSSSGTGPTAPPPPPGPSTVMLPSGRSVTFTAEATQAYASGATLSQPGPQLLASPQVQAAAGSIIQAASSGGMVQAVTNLATGGLSLPEQRAVLASVPVPTLIGGLTASSDPVAVRVGGILQNSAAGQPGGYAQVRATVTQANLPPQLARTYLAMVQRVERDQRTQAFSGALRQLVANPAAADMFGRPNASSAPPSLQQARGGRTRGGSMTLRGIVADSANLAEARVNGRWVFIDEQGQFRTSIPVEPGATEATLTMTDETGKTTEQRIAIDAAATPDPAVPPKPRKIALMIAVDSYRDTGIPALATPDADIKAVGKALNDHLGYETRVLRNPTKAQIGEALRKLGREVGEQDQVMVYYAGHGYELAETGAGYWLPADAETTSARNWVSNNDIGRFLSRMPAKHVMLVSDSCYSGAFTKEQKVDAARLANEQEIRQRRSVMALSSGGDEPVADGEVNSPFAAALRKRVLALPKDSNGYALYQEVREDVTRDAPQTPQYGVIRTAGYDEGGDFLLDRPDRPMN